MGIVKINLNNSENEAIKSAAAILEDGGVIICPTDTIYGLSCNALDRGAIEKVFKIKGRNFNKPISIIVKNIEAIKEVADISKEVENKIKNILPGPITIVLFKKEILPDILTAGSKKIGIRIPDCKITKLLMEDLNFPITTTSANISDEPYSGDIGNMLSQFKQEGVEPDLVLDAGFLPESEASTVVDLTEPEPLILREGAIKKEKLLKLLNL